MEVQGSSVRSLIGLDSSSNNKTTMALAREIWDPNNKKSLNRSNVNSTIGLPIDNSTFSSGDNDWV
jgi:hypothetical protein